ncbi:hypothetical protein Afil01_21330 [Actinorhabdospora filicis]|uniref:Sensory transduction regulator n=1 Tax=Actinorhabdospora filicis TaxID=1785913 RepID=A0A9W6SKE6_9ACTN|nr:YbjN domain-containing protein [Actinorhabdospora filicis]GLZ77326.1 hypothetical protein Afil01_21330 [Actinorhabdospora filicis]
MTDPLARILDDLGVDWEPGGPGVHVVTLPGTHKLVTNCRLVIEDHALRVEAFVIRHPDENREEFHLELLRRNARMYAVAFTVDTHGDVWLIGRLPLTAITPEEIDRVLGSVLTYADESFDPLLEIGFAESIRREWRWRLSRGESTRNLAAFEHLRPEDA